MSFGKSSSSSSQEMDPQIKQSLLDVFQRGRQLSYTPYNPYQFATVAPMSPFQQQGMQASVDAARAGIGRSEMQGAIDAARGVSQYSPTSIRGMDVAPQQSVGQVRAGVPGTANDVTAQQLGTRFSPTRARVSDVDTGINAGDVRASNVSADYSTPQARINQAQALDTFRTGITEPTISAGPGVTEDKVTAGSFADTNIDPYMSRFQTGVIDAALGDIERQRQIQQNQNKAAAVAGGAFGGDRQAILEAETNRAALEQSARTAAQLRQSGFESAARLAEADLARQTDAARANQQAALQADLANQAVGLDASKTGGQLGLQAQTSRAQLGLQDRQQELQRRMTNVAEANQMNRANQSARLQEQGLRQRALLANQDAGLQAQLANQRTALAEGQAANQGALQTQRLGADASRANQTANLQTAQLGAQQARANQQAALQAGLANQQNQRLYDFQTQDAGMEAALANQRTAFQQAELEQARRIQNQDASFQRQLANQNLGLEAAAQRLAGAQQLGALGQDMRGLAFADAAALQGVGNTQRQFAQQLLDDQYRRYQEAQNYPFRMFDVLRSGAGMLPNPTLTSQSGRGLNLGI